MSSMTAATLQSVAKLAGVSTATVARVIHGGGPVSEATRCRVVEAIDRTGYRVNMVASGLRRQRTGTIGHILTAVTANPFFVEVSVGLQEAAARAGFEVMLFNAQGDPARERAGVDVFLGRRVEAIVFTTPLAEENVRLAAGAGVRVVQVERPWAISTPSVVVDNRVGARAATDHLIELGHRRIAFWGPDPPGAHSTRGGAVEADRIAGYRDALGTAGLSPIVWAPPTGEPDAARSALAAQLRQHLADPAPPTAIVAGSDLFAADVLRAAHPLWLRVPDDLSLVGFDDTYAAHLAPALTTVALPMHEMGEAAVRCIDSSDPEHQERLATTLRIRDSTAAPRA
jgi:DNA-binding LacI/PurR family transcriptional regulator